MSCLALLSYLHWRRSAFSVARGCFNRGAPDEQEPTQGARIIAACTGGKAGCAAPQVLTGLATASSGATNAAALRAAVPRGTVVGLLRDIRGIASATNSRRTYGARPAPGRYTLMIALSLCMAPGIAPA